MTPAQFLSRMKRGEIAPAYLFLGSEAYDRGRARDALLDAALGEERESGFVRHDLGEASLAAVIDDARSMNLFAARRVVAAVSAEAALPKVLSRDREGAVDDDDGAPRGGEDVLAAYMRDPSPGVVLLVEATRWDFEGEDKKKLERVRKFYSAIPDLVEFKRHSAEDARMEAQSLARKAGLRVEPSAMELLVESLGNDMARIATEIEKLSLYAGRDRPVTVDDISLLAPEARATTIFALVAALGRRDRVRSLEILDTLSREGEYLPLALAFLSTQFRLALVAREAGLRGPQQIVGHFTRMGIPMWSGRADQVYQTLAKFSGEQLGRAMKLIYEADKGLRSARPDDRIVMEDFVLRLTA
jgi:DNA polymerase III subunit delta